MPRNICFICPKKGSWKIDSSSKAVADEFSCLAIFYCTHTAILGELNMPLKGEFNQGIFWYGAHMHFTCLHCTHACKVNEGSDQKMNPFLFPLRNLYIQHFLPFLQTKNNCTRVYFYKTHKNQIPCRFSHLCWIIEMSFSYKFKGRLLPK